VPLAVIDESRSLSACPMGPIELADTVGLDVCSITSVTSWRRARARPAGPLSPMQERIAAGKLGAQDGEGFYRWVDGKAVKAPAPGVSPPADLQDRLILALLNECVACLREQVVEDADLLDAGVIFGTGFAPFRGGPLQYARQRGIPAVVARLRELQARHGTRFTPDPGWDRLA
jgi:3-hydroxyacyl-CoA dehydrogenase / enoyl-CoA hydratase / 3-hydroxybutyryl-CoA epimerase